MGRLVSTLGGAAHLWMWDQKSLIAQLESHGFVSVRPATFGDAEDPMFNLVEEQSRFEDAVAIEARKP